MAGIPEGVVLLYAYNATDTAHLYGILTPLLHLLFGIDPELPVDLLLPYSEDTATNSGEWLAWHQNRRPREAHNQAQQKLEVAAADRKQRYDSRKKGDPACIGIGERVLLRSHPQGRKKVKTSGGAKSSRFPMDGATSMRLNQQMACRDQAKRSTEQSCRSSPSLLCDLNNSDLQSEHNHPFRTPPVKIHLREVIGKSVFTPVRG